MTVAPRKPDKPSGCVEHFAYDPDDRAARALFVRRLATARLFGVAVGAIDGDIQVVAVEHYPYQSTIPEKGIDVTADVSGEPRAITVRVDRDLFDFAQRNPGMVGYTLEEDAFNEQYGWDVSAAHLALGAFAAKEQGEPYRHSIALQPDAPSPFSVAA